MSQRVDFSGNAKVYDRRHGAVLTEDVVQRLAAAGAIRSGTNLLDIGAGTGRVAIGLAELGCDVVALEPALGRLETLRTKAGNLPIRLITGEGASLPFSAGQFDVVVIARVLYLTGDWRGVLREAHRVLAVGGRLLHEWGNGQTDEEWVQIREKARALFERPASLHRFILVFGRNVKWTNISRFWALFAVPIRRLVLARLSHSPSSCVG